MQRERKIMTGKEALVTWLDVFTVMGRDIRMAYPGKNGHYAVVEYGN